MQPACGAVVGVGFFAENHLHAWKELEVPIATICDVDEERLNEVGEQFGIPAVCRRRTASRTLKTCLRPRRHSA